MPPPSSGGICLAQISSLLKDYRFSTTEAGSARHLHLLAEAMRRSFADRNQFLGDPDFVDCQTQMLLSADHLNKLRSSISEDVATLSSNFTPSPQGIKESEQTTHYSVVDPAGNGVAVTTTLNGSFGSKVVVPGTGFLLNNEMDDFSAKPGVPNAYGMIGGDANSVQAGKRPLSSMSPTFILKNKKPFLITGSPGGSRIITTTLQMILNVIDHDMNLAEATISSRIHHQWLPDEIRVEKSLNKDTVELLKQKGHKVIRKSSMGSTQSIMLTEKGLWGYSDLRRSGALTTGY